MKKILFLFVFLFSAVLLAQTQNWTSVKETNINVVNAVNLGGVDIFTNRDGNHIIVQESNNLKYYKMDLDGVSSSPIIIEYSSVVSPSISGNADNIYIVYGIGMQLRVKRSTNGGTNWTLIYSPNLATNASWMESVVSNGNLHVTYLESGIVKYRYLYQNSTWNGPYTVSTGETGTYPKITARYTGSGSDFVYFMWQKSSTNQFNWRIYDVADNSWETSVRTGYIVSEPNLISANLAGIRVAGPNLVVYHSFSENATYSQRLGWAWIRLTDNTLLGYLPNPGVNFDQLVYSTTTFDNTSHSAYYYEQIAGGEGGSQSEEFAIRRSNSITGYPDDIIYDYNIHPNYYDPKFVNLSSAGNEVHVIWKDDYGSNNGNNLRYKFDNQPPVAPQNLSLSSEDNHPKLTWDKNPDADIDYYRIYKKIGTGSYPLNPYATSGTNEYVDYEETVCDPPPGSRCDNEVIAHYKVSAKDLTSYISGYSNEVEAVLLGEPPHKINSVASDIIHDYKLEQNFPNPFNPSTNINYQVKDKGFVFLKVYDMLGREVASLVNETQDAEKYSVIFNAANLPSGVYIYSLRVNDFVQNNKMTLVK